MTTTSKIFVIIIISLVSQLFGYTWLGVQTFGDPVRGFSARSLGMGAVGIGGVNDATCLFTNPAQLVNINTRQLSMSFGLIPLSEEIISYGQPRFYNEPVWFSVNQFSFVLPHKENLVLAFGIGPRFDWRYRRMKDIYISGVYQEQENILSDGQLFGVDFGLGYKYGRFSFGLAGEYLKGNNSYLWEYLDYYYSTKRYYERKENLSGRGINGRFGLDIKVGKKTSLNFVYNTRSEVTDEWSVLNATVTNISPVTNAGQYQITIPASYGLGLVYSVSEPQTEIVIEALKTNWSEIRRQTYNPQTGWLDERKNLKDVLELHFGVEHYLTEDLPLRYGFYLLPYEGDDRFQFLGFSAGFGLRLGGDTRFDFGLEFGRRNFVDEVNKTYNYEMLYKYLGTIRVKI